MRKSWKLWLPIVSAALVLLAAAGPSPAQKKTYDLFETPRTCAQCHKEIFTEWKSAMMSQAYTHHWDEIEYFKLAVPQAERDPKVAEVKAGCNGCHAPAAFFIGDTPPPLPSAGFAGQRVRLLRHLPHHLGLPGRYAVQFQLHPQSRAR